MIVGPRVFVGRVEVVVVGVDAALIGSVASDAIVAEPEALRAVTETTSVAP